MKTTALGWLLLLQLGLGLQAQAQNPIPRTLLRIHMSYVQGGGHGLRLVDEDLFLSTDRSSEAIVSRANNTSPLPPPWFQQRNVAIGSPQAFATLVAILADNRVAQQAGDCSVLSPLPGDSGTVEVTWYSRDLHKNVIVTEVNGSLPPCQPEIARILNGIQSYALATGIPLAFPVLQ